MRIPLPADRLEPAESRLHRAEVFGACERILRKIDTSPRRNSRSGRSALEFVDTGLSNESRECGRPSKATAGRSSMPLRAPAGPISLADTADMLTIVEDRPSPT